MKQRDTIIIAVLVNVGLLVVLFATSMKSSSQPAIARVETLPVEHVDKSKVEVSLPSKQPFEPLIESKSKPSEKETPLIVTKPVPVEPVKPQTEAKNLIPVVVKQGDVLEKIAKAHHTSIDEVMKINRLPSTFLKIGQVLYIPVSEAKKEPEVLVKRSEKKEAIVRTGNEIATYTVKNGDNPWTIAVKNKIKVEELLKLNELDEESARKIKPGDTLRIR